jgi:hypothetical protein
MSQTLEAPTLRRVYADPADYLDDLLMFIRDGLVIPIIGPELVTVDDGERGQVPLYDYLARRLAEHFRLTGRLAEKYTLQDVVSAYTQDGRPIENIYPRISSILAERPFATPPALRRLAGIREFRLFITTTFDSLMVQAVDEARFGAAGRTQQIVYAGTRTRGGDLEPGWEGGSDPIVFHLLGKASSAPNYVVTEEDTLEFVYKLQADAPQMHLFDELTNKHLLILGCTFPDWLARFFIRMAKRNQLSSRRAATELLADSRTSNDHALALFLDNFSYSTRVFRGSATDFVDLLVDRWQAKYGAPAAVPAPPAMVGDAAGEEMPRGAVLISYASQDRAAAERLRTGLEQVTDVWLDRDDLVAGDDYDLKIRRSISKCSLFVPVLSRNAAGRLEGYFRGEWRQALSRKNQMADELPFIVPVIVDELAMNSEGVPETFWACHATPLPGGEATPEFLTQVAAQVRRVRMASRGQP